MKERIVRYFNANENEIAGPFKTGRQARGYRLEGGGKLIRCRVNEKGQIVQRLLY